MTQLVIDHLWQSTLFGFAALLLTLMLRQNAARLRYWIWFAASIKFLVPFSVLAAIGASFGSHASAPLPGMELMIDVIAAPKASAPSAWVLYALLSVWLMGASSILVLWGRRYFRMVALVRAASLANIAAPMPVKLIGHRGEPGLVGILRPVLVMPVNIAHALTPNELRSIIAHEQAHRRNGDNATAAAHMLVQALFWFHPMVWWIGAKLIEERERACDEAVLVAGVDPQTYAEAILKVCRLYVRSPLICASGVSGADLKQRVEDIMMNRKALKLNLSKKFALGFAALSALGMPMVSGWAEAAAADVVQGPRAPDTPNAGAAEIYPADSKVAREEGVTLLLLTVDSTGDVIDAKVDQSSGHRRLDDAALAAALEKWHFKPGTINAQPSEMKMRIRVDFKLSQ